MEADLAGILDFMIKEVLGEELLGRVAENGFSGNANLKFSFNRFLILYGYEPFSKCLLHLPMRVYEP